MKNLKQNNFKTELKFVYSDNNSLSIVFQDNDLLLGVVGEFNNNLKELEKLTNTSIYSRGNSILIKSDSKKNNLVKNAIQFLTNQFLTNGNFLVLTPRFSPNTQEITYLAYYNNEPRVYIFNLLTGEQEMLGSFPGMTFAPRFSPDGSSIIMSYSNTGLQTFTL